MLLVKSKELKNLDNDSNKIRAWLSFALCLFLSFPSFAQSGSGPGVTSILSIFLSLLLVIAIVFMLAYLMRRFNVVHSGSNELKVVASMMAGNRERIMVLQVGKEQHLVGVTAHNINHLAKLEDPLNPVESSIKKTEFATQLASFMSGKLQSSKSKDHDSDRK